MHLSKKRQEVDVAPTWGLRPVKCEKLRPVRGTAQRAYGTIDPDLTAIKRCSSLHVLKDNVLLANLPP